MAGTEAEITLDGLRTCRVPAPGGWREGEAVTVVLRPERLSLSDAAGAADGAMIGRVDQVAHLGNLVNYRIAFGDRPLLAQAPAGRRGHFALGDAVAIAWDDADLAPVGP